MTQQTFTRIAGAIFVLITLMHALRLLLGWNVMINGCAVPHAVSWLALAIFGGLSVAAFKQK